MWKYGSQSAVVVLGNNRGPSMVCSLWIAAHRSIMFCFVYINAYATTLALTGDCCCSASNEYLAELIGLLVSRPVPHALSSSKKPFLFIQGVWFGNVLICLGGCYNVHTPADMDQDRCWCSGRYSCVSPWWPGHTPVCVRTGTGEQSRFLRSNGERNTPLTRKKCLHSTTLPIIMPKDAS